MKFELMIAGFEVEFGKDARAVEVVDKIVHSGCYVSLTLNGSVR